MNQSESTVLKYDTVRNKALPSQESERLWPWILPLSTILIFDFRIVPTVLYFWFHFIQ
jgi:hypothetical protein